MAGLASGKSVVLSNNGSESLTKNTNGGFEFKTKVEKGKAYNVTVATQPTGQSCTVTNGSGTATGAVTNIKVQCTDVAVGGSDTSEACFNNPQMFKPGNTWKLSSPFESSTSTVIGNTTYRGHAATEVRVQTSLGVTAHTYSAANINGVGWAYGSVMTVPSRHETYYDPGLGHQISLKPNQSYTSSYNQITVQPGSPDYTIAVTHTTTYLGRETVTTAFGTFETCKMQYSVTSSSGNNTWKNWVIASGKLAGFTAQSEGQTAETKLTNIEVSW